MLLPSRQRTIRRRPDPGLLIERQFQRRLDIRLRVDADFTRPVIHFQQIGGNEQTQIKLDGGGQRRQDFLLASLASLVGPSQQFAELVQRRGCVLPFARQLHDKTTSVARAVRRGGARRERRLRRLV